MDMEKFYRSRKNIMLIAILCCALWGNAYPAIKVGYELFNILTNDIASKLIFAGYRFFIAGILVLIVKVFRKKNIFDLSKRQAIQVTILGIGKTTLQYMFFYIGLSYTTGVRGSIINGTGTFFSIILAHFIYKNDKINFNKILGCIIGFAGIIVVNLNGESILNNSVSFYGKGFLMIAAFLLSSSSIYGKRITQKLDASIATGYQLTIGGAILTISGFSLGGKLVGFTFVSSMLLLYMAILSSFAFVLWTELLKYNKVGLITVFNFLIPVFGTLLSSVFLDENIFDVKILIALVLVCIGIFLVYRVKNNKEVVI